DGIRDLHVTGVQTCALPILLAQLLADQGMDQAGTPSVRANARKMSSSASCAVATPPAASCCHRAGSARQTSPRRRSNPAVGANRSEERRGGKECRERRTAST